MPVVCRCGTPCRDMCACGKNTDHLEDEEGGRKHPAEESYIWKKKKFYFDGRQNKTIRPVFSGQPSLMLFLGKSGEAGTPDGLRGGGASFVVLWVSLCLCALAFPPNLESRSYLFWCVMCSLVGGDSRGNNRREGVECAFIGLVLLIQSVHSTWSPSWFIQ